MAPIRIGGLIFVVAMVGCSSPSGDRGGASRDAGASAAPKPVDPRITESVFGKSRLAMATLSRINGGNPVGADGTLADAHVVLNALGKSVEAVGVEGPQIDWNVTTTSPVRTSPATYGVSWTSSATTDKLAFAVYNTGATRGITNSSQVTNGWAAAATDASIFVLTNLYASKPDLLTFALDGTTSESFGNSGLIFNFAGTKLYALSRQGTLYCFTVPAGGVVGSAATSASACAGWTNYSTGATVTYSSPWPVYDASGSVTDLYFGDDNGKLYRVNGATGASVWSSGGGTLATTTAALAAPVVIYDNTAAKNVVYAGDNVGRFFRVVDDGSTPTAASSNVASSDLCGSTPGSCATTPWAIRTSPTVDLTYSKMYVASGGSLFEFPVSASANWQASTTAKSLVASATQIMSSNPVIDYDNGWLYEAYNNKLYKVKYPFDGSASSNIYSTTLQKAGPDASYPWSTPLAYNNLVYVGSGTGTDGNGLGERYGCTGSSSALGPAFLDQTASTYGAYIKTAFVLDWLAGNVNFGYENAAETSGGLVQFKPSGSPDWTCPAGMSSTSATLCGATTTYCTPSCCPTPVATYRLTSSTCSSGVCTAACSTGYANCNGSKNVDGCEVSTNTDVSNCGGCGIACSTNNITPTCTSGSCGGTCTAGYANCNGSFSDGCETAVSCGSCCGATCTGGQVCSGGACITGSNTVCATVSQNQTATLTCPAGTQISSVTFASYGTPTGSCGSFATSGCHAATSSSVVSAACLGQSSCSIAASNANFGDPGCGSSTRLYVQVACSCLTVPGAPTAVSGAISTSVSTVAGGASAGNTDGNGTSALFSTPFGITLDTSGNLWVGDAGNDRIRKIVTSTGDVTTFAGTTNGFVDGAGATTAKFRFPTGLSVDTSGNIFLADQTNFAIRKITSAGVVSTFAGAAPPTATSGYVDATGNAARFNSPPGVAMDSAGTLYVADRLNRNIRMITSGGVVTTIAGSTSGVSGTADGTGTAALFSEPYAIAIDASGNLYIADNVTDSIRKITPPSWVVTTLAGSPTGVSGYVDGTGSVARFRAPRGVAVNTYGNLYVGDYSNNRIRAVSSTGVATTYAGSGTSGFADGAGTLAQFKTPANLVVDSSNNIYVADYGNNRIRKVTSNGQIVVSWTAPASTGGISINSYTAAATASGQTTRTCTATSPTTNCTISSLTPGVAYSIAVTATNSVGTGTGSTAVTLIP